MKRRLVGVYVNGDVESKLEELGEWMEKEKGESKTLIEGDFNARTREEGDKVKGEVELEEKVFKG